MSVLDSNLVSIECDTINANLVKDIVLERLEKDGVITNVQALEYSEKWQVIVMKTNWFKRWLDKYKMTKDSYQYKYVKFED